ncbi:MAG: glycine dehydrogenase (aminomethyl-transferring), partial [Propionibacterium sp.]
QSVPTHLRQQKPLDWDPVTEGAMLERIRRVAAKNQVYTSLIGQGYYATVTPPAIQRNILENPGWYTAYTPYQAEISQGRLEALLNFQTMIIDLTGLEVAGASLLDEPTAAAEAMVMAHHIAKGKKKRFFVADDLHPQIRSVLATRAKPLGIELISGPVEELDTDGLFGAIFGYPNTYGEVRDYSTQFAALHDAGALAIVAADLLALTLLKDPGSMGADIAVGSAQRFGVPMGYGGPHAGYLACRDKLKRSMPGRIVGVSKDSAGNAAYRLALQAREQHIRREKATSNICTAQALLAVMASMYAVFHGAPGLTAIAQQVHLMAVTLAKTLESAGFEVKPDQFFDTITIEVGPRQAEILVAAASKGI